YKRLLLAAQPVDGDDANYKSIVVVFTDLPAAQAKDFFSGVLQQIGDPSYADDGLVMGPFYEGNDGTAILEVLFEQRRLAQALGASLWRVRSRSSCLRSTSLPVASKARLIREIQSNRLLHCTSRRQPSCPLYPRKQTFRKANESK